MKYEYTTKPWLLSTILNEMYSDWWRLAYYDKQQQISVWDKPIKARTNKIIKWQESKQWLEFIELYRTINKNGSYSDTLLRKYEIVLKEHNHSNIIKNLNEYIEHIAIFEKPPLQVGTYLNQKRFLDPWETVKVDFSTKWIDERLKEREVPAECKEPIMWEVSKWKANHWKNPSMEFTVFKLDAIIDKYHT